MPESPNIPSSNYNRKDDFLDTGFSNVETSTPITQPYVESQPDTGTLGKLSVQAVLDGIMKDVATTKFSNELSNPIRTNVEDTRRYNDPVHGFDPLNKNLEFQYGDRQGFLEQWKNNLVKFGANAGGSFIESLATIPLVVNAIKEGDFDKIYNNELTTSISEFMEELETTLPNFQSKYEDEHPIASYINPKYWGNSWGGLIKNLGFTVGAIAGTLVQDAAIGLATGGAGIPVVLGPQMLNIAGKLGRVFAAKGGALRVADSLKNAKNVKEAVEAAYKTTKILDSARYGLSLTTSALAEAALEANPVMRNIEETLTNDFRAKTGRDPMGQEAEIIKEYSLAGGNADLALNTALLVLTNNLTLGSVLKPRSSAIRTIETRLANGTKVATKKGDINTFEKVADEAQKFKLLRNAVSKSGRAIRTTGIEGFEEGMQFVFERGTEDYYKRKFDKPSMDTVDNFMKSAGTGLKDAVTTREGLESIFMGMMSGGIIHGLKKWHERARGIDSNEDRIANSMMTMLNSERVTDLFSNKYGEAVTSQSIAADMEKALDEGDVFKYQSLKFQSLYNFVSSGARANKFDMRIQQLEAMKDLKPEEFEKMFGIDFSKDSKSSVSEYVDAVIEKAKDIKKNIDKVNTVFKNPYPNTLKDEATRRNYLAYEEYKNQLALNLSEMADNKRRLNDLTAELSEMVPNMDIHKVTDLTHIVGVENAKTEFEERLKQIDESLSILSDDKSSQAYKDAKKEKDWINKIMPTLVETIAEGYHPDIYSEVGEILNYHANGNRPTNETLVSPIDLLPILEKAQDAFKLMNANNRALYHYQQLTGKKGFDDYMDEVLTSMKKVEDEAADEVDLSGDPKIPNERDTVVTDRFGNEVKDVAEEKQEETKEAEAKATKVRESSQEAKKAQAARREYEAKKAEIAKMKATEAPAEDIRNAEKEAVVLNEAVREAEEEAINNAGNIVAIDGAIMATNNAEEVVDISEIENPTTGEPKPRPTSSKYNRNGKIGTDPYVIMRRLYSNNFKDSNKRDNLVTALYSQTIGAIYNKIALIVKNSIQGKSVDSYSPIDKTGKNNLYRSGFAQDIEMFLDGKSIGIIQPHDSVYFKRDNQYVSIYELQPSEYESVTGNDPATYDMFMEELADYKAITEGILTKFKNGQTEFQNAEVQTLFDILPQYGTVEYSDTPLDSTLIKNLKYRIPGEAILSLPMVYKNGLWSRSETPDILNSKELSPEDLASVQKLIADRIDQIRDIDSRYIYIVKFPDGYKPASIVAMRPVDLDANYLSNLLTKIRKFQLAPNRTKEQARAINNELYNNIFIADSNVRGKGKGFGNEMHLKVNETGEMFISIYNSKSGFAKAYALPDAAKKTSIPSFASYINQVLREKAKTNPSLSRLGIRISEADFKSYVGQDDQIKKISDVEDVLAVSSKANVINKGSVHLYITPKGKGAQAKPKPQKPSVIKLNSVEQNVIKVVKANINDIKGAYRQQIEQYVEGSVDDQKAVLNVLADQYSIDPNGARNNFGEAITEAALPLVGGRVVTNKRSMKIVLQEVFGLTPEEALASSEIYDRVAKTWAARHNKTKEDFYRQLTFMKGSKLPTGAMPQSADDTEDPTSDLIDKYLRTPEDQMVGDEEFPNANFTEGIADDRNKQLRSGAPEYLNQNARAAIRIAIDGKATIYALTDPNVSSPLHELAHFYEQTLTNTEVKTVLDWAGTKEWNVETSEMFARGFEKYLAEGNAPSSALKLIFDNFKKWLTDIYKGIVGSQIDIELNDAMRSIYAQMIGADFKATIAEEVKVETKTAPKAKKLASKPTAKVEAAEDVSLVFDKRAREVRNDVNHHSYDIVQDGTTIGNVSLNYRDDLGGYQIENVKINKVGEGIGTKVYRKLIDSLDKPIVSDSSRTAAVDKVWNKLVDEGLARYDKSKDKFFSIAKITDPTSVPVPAPPAPAAPVTTTKAPAPKMKKVVVKNNKAISLELNTTDSEITVKAVDEDKTVGTVVFKKNDDGSFSVPNDNPAFVKRTSRRQGVATAMYDFVEEQGVVIKTADILSKEGKAFTEVRAARRVTPEAPATVSPAVREELQNELATYEYLIQTAQEVDATPAEVATYKAKVEEIKAKLANEQPQQSEQEVAEEATQEESAPSNSQEQESGTQKAAEEAEVSVAVAPKRLAAIEDTAPSYSSDIVEVDNVEELVEEERALMAGINPFELQAAAPKVEETYGDPDVVYEVGDELSWEHHEVPKKFSSIDENYYRVISIKSSGGGQLVYTISGGIMKGQLGSVRDYSDIPASELRPHISQVVEEVVQANNEGILLPSEQESYNEGEEAWLGTTKVIIQKVLPKFNTIRDADTELGAELENLKKKARKLLKEKEVLQIKGGKPSEIAEKATQALAVKAEIEEVQTLLKQLNRQVEAETYYEVSKADGTPWARTNTEKNSDNAGKAAKVDSLEETIKVKESSLKKDRPSNVKDNGKFSKDNDYIALKLILNNLQARFGLEYVLINDKKQKWAGKFSHGKVYINMAYVDRTTPFHEYLHPWIEVLEIDNPALASDLAVEFATLVKNGDKLATESFDEVKNSRTYDSLSNKDKIKEAMVRYLSKLAAQNINAQGERITEKEMSTMQRLIKKFKEWLNNIWTSLSYHQGGIGLRPVSLKPVSGKKETGEINEKGKMVKVKVDDLLEGLTLQDVADFTSLTNIAFDLKSRKALLDTLELFQAAPATAAAPQSKSKNDPEPIDEKAIIERIKKRIAVLDHTAKTRIMSDQLEDEVRALRSILANEDTVEALDEYVKQGLMALNWATEEFNRITATLKDEDTKLSQEDVREMNQKINIIKNIYAFYRSDVSKMLKRVTDPDEVDAEVALKYHKIKTRADNAASQIKERSVDLITEWLYPTVEHVNELIKDRYPDYTISKEEFRKQILYANGDVDRMFFLLGSVGSSRDPLSGVVSDVLKGVVEGNVRHDAANSEVLKQLYQDFLKEHNLKNDRKATAEYFKEHYLRKAKVLERTGTKVNEEGKPEPIMEYVERWAFHEQYFVDKWAIDNLKFLESLETPVTEADYIAYSKKVADWALVHGTREKPSEMYRNPEFDKLYGKDKFFSAMYDFYKEANDRLIGEEKLSFGMIPQVSVGKGMFADLNWSKSTLGKLKDRVVKSIESDPNDFVTDYDNLDKSRHRSIKVPYVRALEEEDLDFALPETVFKFTSSVNMVNAMKEIEPNIIVLKSLLDDGDKSEFIDEVRKVNRVTPDKTTLFDRIWKRPAKNTNPRVNKQLVAFIDDVVYGVTEIPAHVGVGYDVIMENDPKVKNDKKMSEDLAKAKQMETDGSKPHEIAKETNWKKDQQGRWFRVSGGFSIDMNKVSGGLTFLTALNNMALNITAGISNVTIGNINSLGEAIGGKYYKSENWRKAQAQYWGSTGEFISDTGRLKKGKVTLLGIKYDAVQGEFRDKYGKRFVGSVAQKYATSDTLFFLSHVAEHQIQLTGMLALMDATKVRLKDGSQISLFDAHVDNGRGGLKLREDAIWTDLQNADFTSRLHSLNKMLNGNYSKFDKAYIQRFWYGKLFMVYRKFLYNGFRSRWGKKRLDFELKDVYEGYYRTFFQKIVSDVKAYGFEGIIRGFSGKSYNADEIYARNKTLYEIGLLAAFWLTSIALASVESDDESEEEKSWIANYLKLLMLRTRGEIGTFSMFGIQDIARIVQNPSATIMTMSKISAVLSQLVFDPTATYDRKTGSFDKGDLILWAKIQKAIPLWRQFIALKSPEESAKFYTLINKNF